MDRCDFPAFWFLFAGCGRPFMYADPLSAQAMSVLKQERRRVIGTTLEQRSGNFAAATIDEMLDNWAGKPKMTVAEDGSFVHVEPADVLEVSA